MSTENEKKQIDYVLHGRLDIKAKIDSVSNGGHQGKLTQKLPGGGDGPQYNFVTQGGLKVEVGNTVLAKAPVDNSATDNPGSEKRNEDHGGPKAIVVEVEDR